MLWARHLFVDCQQDWSLAVIGSANATIVITMLNILQKKIAICLQNEVILISIEFY